MSIDQEECLLLSAASEQSLSGDWCEHPPIQNAHRLTPVTCDKTSARYCSGIPQLVIPSRRQSLNICSIINVFMRSSRRRVSHQSSRLAFAVIRMGLCLLLSERCWEHFLRSLWINLSMLLTQWAIKMWTLWLQGLFEFRVERWFLREVPTYCERKTGTNITDSQCLLLHDGTGFPSCSLLRHLRDGLLVIIIYHCYYICIDSKQLIFHLANFFINLQGSTGGLNRLTWNILRKTFISMI